MSGLVLVLLAAPILAATVAFVMPALAARLVPWTAIPVGAGWALVATADEAVTVGELTVDARLAAAAVGLAVLVAVVPARTAGAAAAGLLVLSVGPLGAALEVSPLPDRRLAAGIALVGVLAAVRLWRERSPRTGRVLVVLAAVVLATGLVGSDPAEAVALTAAGTTVAVLASMVWGLPGRLLLPLGLLAVSRAASQRAAPEDIDWALVVVAALLAVGALVLVVVRHRPVTERLPLAGVLAAVGLLATEVDDLRAAGALLGAGAVLALAGRHPVALAALLPGLAAAFDAAGAAYQPEHALVGAAAVVVLGLAVGAGPTTGVLAVDGRTPPPGPATVVAGAFAVVPLWGWAAAPVDAYQRGVAVAVAVAVVVVLLTLLVPSPDRPGPRPSIPFGGGTDGSGRLVGTIVGRPRGTRPHGTALHDAEPVPEAVQQEAGDASPS